MKSDRTVSTVTALKKGGIKRLFENVRKQKRRLGRLARVGSRALLTPAIAGDIVNALAHRELDRARSIAIHCQQGNPTPELVVSRKYGFLCVSNAKVASRSMVAVLLGTDPNAEIIRNRSFSEVCARYPEVKSYYSFAFVRHPFDRAVSFHTELRHGHERYEGEVGARVERRSRHILNSHFGLAEATGFDDHCRWLNTPYGSDRFADRHFLSQHLCIRLGRNRLPDFVGRFENIQADLERVAAHVDMPIPMLPMLNTAAGWVTTPEAWRAARPKMVAQLTERNKALLEKRYAEDFKLFGYSP